MPVKHVVMFGIEEDTTEEQTAALKEALLALPSKITTIKSYELGFDLKLESGQNHPAGKNRSCVWECTFATAEEYEAYATHPDHVAVIDDYIKPIMEPGSRAAVQYTVDPACCSSPLKRKAELAAMESSKRFAAASGPKPVGAYKSGEPPPPFERVFFPPPPETSAAEMAGTLIEVRKEIEVTVEGPVAAQYPPIEDFMEIPNLPDYMTQALVKNNWNKPLPIQAQALPIILGGHDLIGIARTGSGKTLAFLIPAIVHIEAQEPVTGLVATPIALVLAPTRELASQIADEARKLTESSTEGNHPEGLRAQDVYGGTSKNDQIRKARGCAIVVATPGRLTDFVESGLMSLERVTYFVLDEADRMLDMGFIGDVQKFCGYIRPDRHMMFFSATWPKSVQDLAESICGSTRPVLLKVGQKKEGVATRADIVQEVQVFDQASWEARDAAKQKVLYAHLREVLGSDEETKVLVFVSNKVLADDLAWYMTQEGFTTEAMHGGKQQATREATLAKFKQGHIRLLVATDVMGRGLDIPTISHVVIYDMGDVEDYIHRIGRTARGLDVGRMGHALTLFEYNRKWPHLAEGLVKVLEESQQPVPDALRNIATSVADGKREMQPFVPGSSAPKPKKKKSNQNWEAEEEEEQQWPMNPFAAMMGFGDWTESNFLFGGNGGGQWKNTKKPEATPVKKAGAQSGNPSSVWVGDIPGDISADDLKEVFAACGTVKQVKLMKPGPRGTARVDFGGPAEASQAIELFNGFELYGENIQVDKWTSW